MINPGNYNKRITIYRITEKEDDSGFKQIEKTVVLSPFAKVKTTKGFTLIANHSDFEKAYNEICKYIYDNPLKAEMDY